MVAQWSESQQTFAEKSQTRAIAISKHTTAYIMHPRLGMHCPGPANAICRVRVDMVRTACDTTADGGADGSGFVRHDGLHVVTFGNVLSSQRKHAETEMV